MSGNVGSGSRADFVIGLVDLTHLCSVVLSWHTYVVFSSVGHILW